MDGRQEVTVGWGQGAGWGRLQDSVSAGCIELEGGAPRGVWGGRAECNCALSPDPGPASQGGGPSVFLG